MQTLRTPANDHFPTKEAPPYHSSNGLRLTTDISKQS